MNDPARLELDASPNLLGLDRQLCFALYAAVRAITRTYREQLEPLALTYPQYLVLLVLFEQEGITVSEIGRQLFLDSGTLTPVIKRLEANGFVRRERSSNDERAVHVWLKSDGQVLRPKLLEVRRFVARRLGMTEAQISSLRLELMDVVHQLEEGRTADQK